MSKPYPRPKSMMLSSHEAPKVYQIESDIREQFEVLEEALEPFVYGGRYTHRVPYMLFCLLEGYNQEASIAAALGFLQHVKEQDRAHGTKRESLKGLRLPTVAE